MFNRLQQAILFTLKSTWAFSGGSVVKNLPAMQEMWVWSLGQEDTLEKEMATHSSILDWEIPWTGRLQFMASQKNGCNLATKQQQQQKLRWNHVEVRMTSPGDNVWKFFSINSLQCQKYYR